MASLGIQFVLPKFPLAGLIIVLCTMVYVQALVLRLAVGVADREISLGKACVISLLTVVIGFVGVIPCIAWSVKHFSG